MSDLDSFRRTLAEMASRPRQSVALAVAVAEVLARSLTDDQREAAGVVGRVVAKLFASNSAEIHGALTVAAQLDEGAPTPAPDGCDAVVDQHATLGERLSGALLRTEAGQAALAVRAERAGQARAALDAHEVAFAEAKRIGRSLDLCRRRAADLERRFEVAREALTRAGASSRTAVDALAVVVLP